VEAEASGGLLSAVTTTVVIFIVKCDIMPFLSAVCIWSSGIILIP